MSVRQLQTLNGIGNDLKKLRLPYESLFRQLGENFSPTRSRFNRGHRRSSGKDKSNSRILNARPRLALRTMQSGMHTGITSPARPWFRLIPADPELRRVEGVRLHIDSAQREMRQLLQSSGLYTTLHTMWGDLGLYGYDGAILEDDDRDGLYGQALVAGEYWIAANGRGVVDTLYREIDYTVKQVVGKFVYHNDPTSLPDWSKVSTTVKNLWDAGNETSLVRTKHLIMPRTDRDPRSKLAQHKPTMSTYWEASESIKILGDLGYDDTPILSSRWDVEGTDTYGSSPAMDALGDAKELQRKERDKAEAVRRMNRPPMNVDVSLRNSAFSLMPEAVNYVADPSKGAQPAFQIQPRLDELRNDIRESEQRINEAMYANLFLMLANLDDRQRTAREVDERHEEKLLALGPVLERQHREKLAVVLRRCYNRVVDAGKVVPLPPEYAGIKLKTSYTSTLGQAQKAVATGGIERLYGFVGNVAGTDPSALDKLDNDAAIDEYADLIGTSTKLLRASDKVDEIRSARAQAQQQQQALDTAQQGVQVAQGGAQAAKLLSQTDTPSGGPRDILKTLGLQ